MPKLTKRQQEASDRRKGRILMFAESGIVQAEIARRCNCSQQYVSKVLNADKGKTK